MSSLAHLKGQRTRLSKKIDQTLNASRALLATQISNDNIDTVVEEIDVHIDLCKDLCTRYETLSVKIADIMDNNDDKEVTAEGEASTEILLELSEIISRLGSRQRKIRAKEQSTTTSNTGSFAELTGQIQSLFRSESTREDAQPSPRCSVNLPKLDFDSFSGDVLKWSEFWDSFSASVHHNSSLQAVQKFPYLRAKLRGEAKSVIAGLETTNENYEAALSLLRQRFGNQQAAISTHYSKLMDIPAAPIETSKLRILTDSFEQELRCLSSLGEDVNHRHFISLIMHKLPEETVTRLEELKGPDEEWSVDMLRKNLQIHLSAREAASRHNSSTTNCGKNYYKYTDQRQRSLEDKRGYASSHRWENGSSGHGRHTTGMLYSNERHPNRRFNTDNTFMKQQTYNNNNTVKAQLEHEKRPRECVFCSGGHWSDECRRYRTVSERKQQVRGRCFNCLAANHKIEVCRSMKPCYHCKSTQQHHSSLCPTKFSSAIETSHVANEAAENTAIDESLLANGERAILQTAIVSVFSPSWKHHARLRILFDSGSHRSYISEDAASLPQLEPKATETISVNTFAEKKSKSVRTQVVDIQLKNLDNSFTAITANVVPIISASIQREPIDLSAYIDLLKGVRIADPVPLKPECGSIDILIGSDYYMDLLTFEKRSLGRNLHLLGSKFGWILVGRSDKIVKSTNDYSMLILHHNNQSVSELNIYKQPDQSLRLDVNTEDFWNMETIGIKETSNDAVDEKAINYFNTTVKKHNDRYFVKWPWKEEYPNLPTNYQLSLGRLSSLVKRFSKNEEMFQKYSAIIEDQLSKGVIEKVPTISSSESIRHYIPHQAVVTPEKATTKVRIVYDASAKVNKSVSSLNECLFRGPVILANLCGLLMRFRLHRYAVVADIEKAFLQIGLQEEDRDVVRFLWIRDPSRMTIENNVQAYRFTRVPFGVISSPFLLAATVLFHLNNCGTAVAVKLSQDIYVDNVITGASSETCLQQLYTESKQLFNEASMNLREWASNSKQFNKCIASSDVCKDKIPKVLGLYWNINDDSLGLSKVKCEIDNLKITKREVFKKIAQFFDPLGQFAPVTIRAKMYMQELWSNKVSWDEQLSPEIKVRWLEILKDLGNLNQQSIPRYIGAIRDTDTEWRLVGFCDASSKAYATVIYLHQTNNDSTTKASMIFSMSRLAPIKRETIPRLELLAVLIGVRALKFTKKQLQPEIKGKSLWSDSQCVLHWVKSTKFQPSFIQNRLTEIKSHADVSFNYVKSEDNPADIPSRGMSAVDIQTCSLWWNGPSWLGKDSSDWPKFELETRSEPNHGQDRPTVLFEASLQAKEEACKITSASPFNIKICKYSSLSRLLPVTAWVMRFLERIAKSRQTNSKCLTSSEIKAAKEEWEKSVQHNKFASKIKAIVEGTKNDLVRKFNLYLDLNGLIRCNGRLLHSNLSFEAKFPKFLPKDNEYTSLVIEYFHCKLLHAGVSQTLAELRREYWIPQGRNQVKKVISKCSICRKWEGGLFKMPNMPALPNCRVASTTPFSYTGVDYFGPLYTKSANITTKAWVCLFTCLTVRAVHLEPVYELSADHFIMALRRFISRRGNPVQIFSDNGTNFRGAAKVLTQALSGVCEDQDVQNYASSTGVAWKFIPEFSPWMGGFYERLIGSVKRHLRKAIGRISLSFIQLQTVLCEVEAVVNSRPLAYVSYDNTDYHPISPAHFLSLNPKIRILPTDDGHDSNTADDPAFLDRIATASRLLDAWQNSHKHLNAFWKAWQADYVLRLRERTQNRLRQQRNLASSSPTVGDVVLVKDELLTRGSRKIARIRTLIPSNDGNYRSARIMLPSGKQLTRPLSLLYPLESAPEIKTVIADSRYTLSQGTKSPCETDVTASSPTSENDASVQQTISESDAKQACSTVKADVLNSNANHQPKTKRLAAYRAEKRIKNLMEQGML